MIQTAKDMQNRLMDELRAAKYYIDKALYCKQDSNTEEAEMYYALCNKSLDVAELLHKFAMHKQSVLKAKHNKNKTMMLDKEEHTEHYDSEHCYKTVLIYDILHENYIDFYNHVVIAANMYKNSVK